ncbi:MAG: acyl-CoA synthetase [Alphaproteobacteria bacterium]|nr:acyl-CoA synthetase [Alphaproteobacteria bacterium]
MSTPISKLFLDNIDANRIIFYKSDGIVHFGEYIKDVAKYANHFSKIPSNQIVIYIPDNFYLFYVCFMAALQAGKDIILPALLTEQNAKPLLETTHFLITDKFTSFDDFEIVNLECENNVNWDFCDVSERFLYFFTSGSTGTPKRIKKQFKMLAAEVAFHSTNQKHLINQNPVMISSVAPYHMYGLLWRFFFPLANGIASDLDIIFTPEELQHKQSVYDKVLFATTPSFLDGITRYQNQYSFKNNCIGIYSSGSLLQTKTSMDAYEMFGVSPFEIFGSTETGGVAGRQQKDGPQWTIFPPVKVNLTENSELLIESDFSCQNPYLMSDIVEKTGDNTFLLKGRGDRMVKIAEERVSLPEMEERLCEYKHIDKSYVSALNSKDRNIVCAVITLNTEGKKYIIENGRHLFVKELKQYLLDYFPNVVLPRKIRIVNTIPVNTQGKYIKSDINAMFESNVAEPIMQNITKTDTEFVADLTFLKDSSYFNGHFPEHPILPGVIQMHFVLSFIKQYFNKDANDYHILKLKFSNLILPDSCVHFELKRNSENEFIFSYVNGDKKYSCGKIAIKA